MKIPKVSLIALLAAATLFSQTSVVRADDESKDSKPAETKPGQRLESRVDARVEHLSEQLSLTDDQKTKVKALFEQQMKDMAGFRELPQEERRSKVMAAREEMNKKMKEILTEEQYKKYEAMPRGGMRPGGQRPNAAGGPGADKKAGDTK